MSEETVRGLTPDQLDQLEDDAEVGRMTARRLRGAAKTTTAHERAERLLRLCDAVPALLAAVRENASLAARLDDAARQQQRTEAALERIRESACHIRSAGGKTLSPEATFIVREVDLALARAGEGASATEGSQAPDASRPGGSSE